MIGPMRRNQVRDFLGVTDWTLRKILAAGDIRQIHLAHDSKGRPRDRALYVRSDVEIVKKKIGGA